MFLIANAYLLYIAFMTKRKYCGWITYCGTLDFLVEWLNSR